MKYAAPGDYTDSNSKFGIAARLTGKLDAPTGACFIAARPDDAAGWYIYLMVISSILLCVYVRLLVAAVRLHIAVARLGEDSRAEAAEAQLRAMKEEVAGLRRAHDLELTSLRTTHKDELAAIQRAFDAERHAIDRSGLHSKHR